MEIIKYESFINLSDENLKQRVFSFGKEIWDMILGPRAILMRDSPSEEETYRIMKSLRILPRPVDYHGKIKKKINPYPVFMHIAWSSKEAAPYLVFYRRKFSGFSPIKTVIFFSSGELKIVNGIPTE